MMKQTNRKLTALCPATIGCETAANAEPQFVSARGIRISFLAAAILAVVAPLLTLSNSVQAQTVPAYVVSSNIQLPGSFNGAKANYAVNSRGDFFVNDGNQHVLEFPASGGPAITLWTVPSGKNYGSSGVAVDPFDNLYVTNFFGPSGNNGIDSQVYEFPSTNGAYPPPYTYNPGAPPGNCFPYTPVSATNPMAFGPNTGVCAVGQYTAAAYYYWQPVGFAADGLGNTYMYSNYDSTYQGGSHGIFRCDIKCNEQLPGGSATTYTVKLSNGITSIISDYAGNVYFTDQSAVNIIPAGSPLTGNVPTVLDSSYTTPYGVTLDASGNLYVTDANAIWEVPAVETTGGAPCKGGTDICTLVLGSKFKVLALTQLPQYSEVSPAVDNRGNIVYSSYYGGVFEASLWSGNFKPAEIGSSGSTSLPFTVVFNASTKIAGFSAVQGSGAATEFTVSNNSCTVGSTISAGSTCTFNVSFTPSGLGVRTGAVLITDGTGNTTVTHLSGVGTGTGIALDPGTPVAIGSGFKTPAGLAVDSVGNVYVADPAANQVLEYPLGGGTAVSVGTGLSVPTGVAVDGAGNVFILNQGTGNTATVGTGSIVEIPNTGDTLVNSAQKTLVTGLNTPTDIVADGDGNLYVSATGSNEVLQLPNASISGSGAMIPRGYGFSGPTGLAIDATGSLYVADTGNNRVLQVGDGFQTAVGNGLSAPTGVAVDASGSVMIADGTGRVIRVPNETAGMNALGLNQADQQVLSTPVSYPYSLRTDNSGNLYVSDSTAAVVYELQRTTGLVNFGSWNLNTVSDAQSIVVSNIGTTDLTLGTPLYPAVPTTVPFTVAAGTGTTDCASGTFPSGYNCTLTATFAPTALGKSVYPLTLAAVAQNAPSATVNLIGTGVNEDAATITLQQTAPTGTISYGQQIIISAIIAPAGSTPTPTGYVVFTFDGQGQRPVKLDGTGAASITFNGVNAGPHNISAYYEGDANYASLDSANLPLNIQLATNTNVLTIVGDSATPLSVAPTHSISFTDTLTPATVGLFTGSVSFVDLSSNTVLATVRLGSPDPKTGNYVAFFSPPAGSKGLDLGNHTIVAQYTGNSNYFPTNSANVPYIVTLPTYTVTSSNSTTVTATASTPGVLNLTVTDYSAFEGGVSLSCSGLPANAYCVFRPASAQLLPAPLTTPLTILPVPVDLQIQVDQNPVTIESASLLWGLPAALGFILIWRRRSGLRGLALTSLIAFCCFLGIVSLGGCGSSSSKSNYPTPAGTYPIVITATSTPLVNGAEPSCSYTNCNLPPGPDNPSINVIQTLNATVTIK